MEHRTGTPIEKWDEVNGNVSAQSQDMLMVVNFEESAKKIYHRQNCEIALEIPFCNRFEMETKKAIKQGYSMCPCCGGLKGDMRLRESQLESLEKKYDFSLTYVEDKDRLYIKTQAGFWMVLFQRDMAKYLLFHRNEYSLDLTFEELVEGPYHRQYDRKPTESLEKGLYWEWIETEEYDGL